MMKKPTANEILKLRVKMGLTQAELATLMELDRRTVIRWENGDREMHPVYWDWLVTKSRSIKSK